MSVIADFATVSTGKVTDQPYTPGLIHPEPQNLDTEDDSTGAGAPDGAGFNIQGHGAPSGAPSTINADYSDDIPWLYSDLDAFGTTYPWDVEAQVWMGV